MSKKTKKAAAQRKPVPSQSKATAPKPSASRSTTSHRAPAKHGPTLNLTAVRVTAGVLGALLLAGLIGLIVTVAGAFTIGVIITAVVLGIFSAICAYAAIRPGDFVNYLAKLPS